MSNDTDLLIKEIDRKLKESNNKLAQIELLRILNDDGVITLDQRMLYGGRVFDSTLETRGIKAVA